MTPRLLAEGLWYWTAPHPDWRPEHGGDGGWEQHVGSSMLVDEQQAVLVDPLVPDDPALLRWLDDRVAGRDVHVFVTVYWHLRSAEVVRSRYGATVWANAKTREEDLETLVTNVITDGADLPGGIVPFTPVPNDADEDEAAYWLPRQRALAVGDILINTQVGLRIWQHKTETLRSELRDRVEPALLRLAALPIELILLSHGEPITGDGQHALRRALDSDPWQRPS